MMFDFDGFDVGAIFDSFMVTFEIESQGKTTKQIMNAPQMMIKNQFVNLVQQAVKINSPCRVRVSRTVTVQDEINHTTKDIEHYLEFKNNAYLNNE